MKIKIYTITLLLSAVLGSCSSSFLDEKPLDFMSATNSFLTQEDIDCSINNLYYLIRREFYSRDENRPMDYLYGTDIVYDGEPNGTERHSNMISAYHSTGNIASVHWSLLYHAISTANTIIDRLPVSEVSEEQKTIAEAKARFFRGFAYRTLAYLYGGVPLLLTEVVEPKFDYVRASKEEVLKQALTDVEFAAAHLPSLSSVQDGEVSNAAAYHLLSELYLATAQYQKAVDAATTVIDDPATGLMYTRFGSRANEVPGDVYWDLFRKNNQNRGSGNTEGIWVIQIETDTPGGSGSLTAKDQTYTLERHHAPMVRDVKAHGMNPFSWPIGDYTGGRGIGWAISTRYFSDEIWKDDFYGDMRNANHNFVRKFAVHNKEYAKLYGDTIDTQNPPVGVTVPSRPLYAYQSKCTTPYNHPEGLYSNAKTYALNSGAGATYTDQYMFRLAETYLLRAEAYLDLNDKDKAAADINVIRNRAHAKPVLSSQVTLDYILDERMRELGVEERRRITLMRMGKLYDRVMKCNPYYAKELEKHYELWPIPYKEIEANRGAVLEQNPGYE